MQRLWSCASHPPSVSPAMFHLYAICPAKLTIWLRIPMHQQPEWGELESPYKGKGGTEPPAFNLWAAKGPPLAKHSLDAEFWCVAIPTKPQGNLLNTLVAIRSFCSSIESFVFGEVLDGKDAAFDPFLAIFISFLKKNQVFFFFFPKHHFSMLFLFGDNAATLGCWNEMIFTCSSFFYTYLLPCISYFCALLFVLLFAEVEWVLLTYIAYIFFKKY